jgi:hypothetical protein
MRQSFSWLVFRTEKPRCGAAANLTLLANFHEKGRAPRGAPALFSGLRDSGGLFLRRVPVEALGLRGHVAQQLRRGEALPFIMGKPNYFLNNYAKPYVYKPEEGPPV